MIEVSERFEEKVRHNKLRLQMRKEQSLRHIKDGAGMCWCCGATEGVTLHHAIPRRLQPLVNLYLPLCRQCHERVHKIGG